MCSGRDELVKKAGFCFQENVVALAQMSRKFWFFIKKWEGINYKEMCRICDFIIAQDTGKFWFSTLLALISLRKCR